MELICKKVLTNMLENCYALDRQTDRQTDRQIR